MCSLTNATLMEIVRHTDEAIGNTENREGDAYQQGVRDLAAELLGLSPLPDRLGIGGLAGALEGLDFSLSHDNTEEGSD